MNLTLTRFHYGDEATLGRMTLPSGLVLYTIERPWLGNRRAVSCIPEGRYPLMPGHFFRGGYDCYAIGPVPNRSHILIHIANWAKDVEGCIGVGTSYKLGQAPMVTNSRVAFARLMAEMAQSHGEIWITNAYSNYVQPLNRDEPTET